MPQRKYSLSYLESLVAENRQKLKELLLQDELDGTDSEIAAEIVGLRLPNGEAVPLLLELLGRKNPSARQDALVALFTHFYARRQKRNPTPGNRRPRS